MKQAEKGAEGSVTSVDGFLKGGPRRVQRIIAEYLASRGFLLTAKKYLKSGDADSASSDANPLADVDHKKIQNLKIL